MEGLTHCVLIHSFIDLCTKTDRTSNGLYSFISSFIHSFYKYFLSTNNMPIYAILDTDYTFFSQLGQNSEQQIKALYCLSSFILETGFR